MTTHAPAPRLLDPLIVAGDADDTANSIILPSTPEATAIGRPGTVDEFWVTHEYTELEREQNPLWDASGQAASRPAEATAASEDLSATTAAELLNAHRKVVDAALQRHLDTTGSLAAFRRRPAGAKIWYMWGKAGVFFGDLAGFASAAIWLGEEIPIAITLAASAATATVAAGLIGTEIRDARSRQGRARPVDELPENLVPFRHLFEENDPGKSLLRRVVGVSLATAAMIGIGIGALRAAVDDPLIGCVFGGIALAVAGGSFLISYAAADQVADLIDHAAADYRDADAEHRRMAADPAWKIRAVSRTEADSIRTEHTRRGQAAQDHVRALRWRILRQNPQIAGHGPAAPPVGRTTRRDEATS